MLTGVLALFSVQFSSPVAEEPTKTIANFENDADLKLIEPGDGVKLSLSQEKVKSGKSSLKVSFPTGEYPGITMTIADGNWMGSDFLRLRVFSPKRVAFGIRIDDVNSRNYDTRFNLETEVQRGWNLFQIPLTDIGQKVDVTKVKRLVLFAMKPPAGLELHFDDFAVGEKLDEAANAGAGDAPIETGPAFDLAGLELVTLFDFEAPESLRFVSGEGEEKFEISREKPKSGAASLKVQVPKGPYPGVMLAPTNRNWKGFEVLLLWVHADRPLKFGLRIDDTLSTDYATRYNRDNLALGAGWTAIVIELSEVEDAIELDAVAKLVLFVIDSPGATLYVDDVALGRRRAKARADQVLFGFEDEAEIKRIGTEGAHPMSLSEERVSAGKKALKVELPAGPWPGIILSPPVTDWSGFDALKFEVHSPRNSGFGIRIDDANSRDYNSRYNQEGVILAGWNTYQVDLRKIKPVNPSQVRSLVLFLMDNPGTTSLYFDNIRLGPYEREIREPVPGEEGPKRDITYSTKVATPHRDWATPYSGGPIRVFAIPSIADGRDLAELMQRMDLDVTAVSIDPNWDVNAWGIGDYYFRGEQNDYRLVNRYVENELTSDKPFDVLLLTTPMGWSDFTPKARRAILQRVRRGAGAVLIAPFRTKDQVVDDRIWGLSPLVRVSDHSVPPDGYLRINWQSLADGAWERVVAAPSETGAGGVTPNPDFVLRGIPLDLIPSRHFKHFKYRSAGTVLARAGQDPVIGIKNFGKGRVIALGYQNAGFTPPAVDPAKTGATWAYWEYYYDLLIRAVIWAAGKESPVAIRKASADDKALNLEVVSDVARRMETEIHVKNQWGDAEYSETSPAAIQAGTTPVVCPLKLKTPSCGLHIVDVILREGGRSVDWATTTFHIDPPGRVSQVVVPDLCSVRNSLSAKVSVENPGPNDVLRVRVEDQWGRVLSIGEFKAAAEVGHAAPLGTAMSAFVRVVAELRRGEALVDRVLSKDVYVVPDSREKRIYRAELGWAGGWKSYLAPTIQGLIADRETEIGPIGRAFLDNGIGVVGLGFGRWNMDQYAKQKRLYHSTKDKAYLVRNPCLSSPEYQADLRKRVSQAVRAKAPYALSDYFTVDEGSLTSYGDAFDFCFSPHCLAEFRKWLQAKYGEIDRLNGAWGTNYDDWDEVEPKSTDEARQTGKFASWGDHRLFMCQVFANTFKLIRDTVRSIDPEGLTVVSGTQSPNPWNACDWYWLDQYIDHISCYSGGEQWALHRSFKPGALTGFWTGYGAHGPGVQHAIWSALFHGITQPRIFWGYAFLNPDLTYSKSGFDMGEAFRAIKDSGVDLVVLHGKRINDGIAIHYSYPSILAAEALGRLEQFESNKSAWVRLIKDIGLQFDFVAAPEVERGALAERGYRALILPMSTAISDKEAEAITKFAQAGGAVLADTQAGLMRENCAVRKAPLWKELGEAELRRAPLPVPAALPSPESRAVGKGTMVRLGCPMSAYRDLRAKEFGGKPYRELVRRLLAGQGIAPSFEIIGSELTYAETTTYQIGSTLVVSFLKEPVQAKSIARSDGTISFEGGDSSPAEKIRIRLKEDSAVADVLGRKSFGTVREIDVPLRSGWPAVLSVQPRAAMPKELRLTARLTDRVLNLEGQVDAPRADPRVFTVRFVAPDGRPHRLYSQAVFSPGPTFSLAVSMARNDPPGDWKVEVTDVLTGVTTSQTCSVK